MLNRGLAPLEIPCVRVCAERAYLVHAWHAFLPSVHIHFVALEIDTDCHHNQLSSLRYNRLANG